MLPRIDEDSDIDLPMFHEDIHEDFPAIMKSFDSSEMAWIQSLLADCTQEDRSQDVICAAIFMSRGNDFAAVKHYAAALRCYQHVVNLQQIYVRTAQSEIKMLNRRMRNYDLASVDLTVVPSPNSSLGPYLAACHTFLQVKKVFPDIDNDFRDILLGLHFAEAQFVIALFNKCPDDYCKKMTCAGIFMSRGNDFAAIYDFDAAIRCYTRVIDINIIYVDNALAELNKIKSTRLNTLTSQVVDLDALAIRNSSLLELLKVIDEQVDVINHFAEITASFADEDRAAFDAANAKCNGDVLELNSVCAMFFMKKGHKLRDEKNFSEAQRCYEHAKIADRAYTPLADRELNDLQLLSRNETSVTALVMLSMTNRTLLTTTTPPTPEASKQNEQKAIRPELPGLTL